MTTPDENIERYATEAMQIPPGDLMSTCCGPVKRCHAITGKEWAFVFLSAVTLLTSLGFTIDRLAVLPKHSDDFTFALVLLLATLMCMFYVTHGIFKERPYEIVVYILSMIVVLVYLIMNFSTNTASVFKMVRMIVGIILTLPNIVLACVVLNRYCSCWWFVFRMSSDSGVQGMLRMYFACRSLITLDLQLQISMLIFVLDNGSSLDLKEKLILGFGVPITVAWLLCGLYGMKWENKAMTGLFLALSVFAFVYIGYRCAGLTAAKPALIFFYATVFCAAVALLTHLAVVITMILVLRNFGRGLKNKLELRPISSGNPAPSCSLTQESA
ncbi:uncharacterized protein LOC135378522 [Ornithodoros turicata]|uniref:uncharacterized protein LOC135378522 n=1 Tax=Ornithodoros turicata TaxID=34597 RepID=UPI00313908AB